jgi:hypothetical protein
LSSFFCLSGVTEGALTRYASPTGSGVAPCTNQATACSLDDANSVAVNGDELVLLPGTYLRTADLEIAKSLEVRGIGAKPSDTKITFTDITDFGVWLKDVTGNSELSNVEVTSAGTTSAVTIEDNNTLRRVISRASAGNGCFGLDGVKIYNSICYGSPDRAGLALEFTSGANTADLKGSTFVGGLAGLQAIAVDMSGNGTVNSSGVIMQHCGAGVDILTNVGNGHGIGGTLTHSNYTSINELGEGTTTLTPPGIGTNQTTDPIFVDLLGGDLHQAAGSPTINAGDNASIDGTADVDGDARILDTTVDIGADEFVAAPNDGGGNPTQTLPPADTQAPQTRVKKRPKKRTTSRKAKFKLDVSEPGMTFRCKLDKGKFKACKSNFTLKVKPGRHKLQIIAVDAVGNADPTPLTIKWTVKRNG